MRVGIDLDGVLFNFADSLKRYLIARGDIATDHIPDGETKRWNFYEDWGFTFSGFKSLTDDGVDAGFVFRGPAREGAVESVNKIADLGHSIHIITDRAFGSDPMNSQIATKEWLSEHGIPYDTLTFSADKTCVPTDCFVEDKLENYDALMAAGVDAYLITRPWNIDKGEDIALRRKRIKSISDFASIIQADLIRVF